MLPSRTSILWCLQRIKPSSVEAKWENITLAMEPFQMEPSLDPETQYLVKRMETKELDIAIGDIETQIQDLEVSQISNKNISSLLHDERACIC